MSCRMPISHGIFTSVINRCRGPGPSGGLHQPVRQLAWCEAELSRSHLCLKPYLQLAPADPRLGTLTKRRASCVRPLVSDCGRGTPRSGSSEADRAVKGLHYMCARQGGHIDMGTWHPAACAMLPVLSGSLAKTRPNQHTSSPRNHKSRCWEHLRAQRKAQSGGRSPPRHGCDVLQSA